MGLPGMLNMMSGADTPLERPRNLYDGEFNFTQPRVLVGTTMHAMDVLISNREAPSVRLPADTTVGGWNPHDNTRAALVARVRASVAPRAIRLSLIN